VYETLLGNKNIIVVCSPVGIDRAAFFGVFRTAQSNPIAAVQNLCFWMIVVFGAV